MDGSGYCNEYTVGFCPYEEFFVHSVTKCCMRMHDEGQRAEYARSSGAYDFEAEVLASFRSIIGEVDKKIEHNERCLSSSADDTCEDVYKALEYAEALIEEKALDASDTAELYSLLRVHGQLVQKASAGITKAKYSVCKTCGSIKVESVCKHQSCPAYSKIRKLCERLESKLGLNK